MVTKKNNQFKKKQAVAIAKDKNQALLGLALFSFMAIKISITLFKNMAEAEIVGKVFMGLGIIVLLGGLVVTAFVMLKPYLSQVKFSPKSKTSGNAGGEVSFNLDSIKKFMEGKQIKDYKYALIVVAGILIVLILKTAHMGYVYFSGNHASTEQVAQKQVEVVVDGMQEGMPVSGDNSMQSMPGMQSEADILASSSNAKKILIPVETKYSIDPFMPTSGDYAGLPNFDLIAPPEALPEDSDAQKVMGTTISGILYDNYSPSAIINISDTDYLVKKGDVVNNYKILSITRNQVVVQLGKNVYKAGVGEILAKGEMNYNTVSNLNKKFGGSPEILINVKKQTY